MEPGKIASQAGHAYLGAALDAQAKEPSTFAEYISDGPGTKVCLVAKDLGQLEQAHHLAKLHGIPSALIIDSGCANFFNGEPTVTALGLGPIRKDNAKIIKKFNLL